MSIDTVSSTASALQMLQSQTRTTSSSDSGLDIDDFMKLLVAQLANQDPMGGSDSGSSGTDYIAQLAQFTMLQQISALNTSMAAGQAYSLIGKYVYLDGVGNDMIFGKVDGVIRENGTYQLLVGGEAYDMSRVYAVESEVPEGTGDQVLQSAYLIGKQVTATVTDETGAESTITGTVDKIRVQDGVVYLVIGDTDVPLDSVVEISTADGQTQNL